MTYPQYTQQALSRYTLPRLKRIAAELGVTPTGDKRTTDTWINAIIAHQSAQLHKVDEQATAQAELDHHITTQAQAIAPEELTPIEISFYDHEYYCGDKLIAAITHDHADFVTQRWVVMVNGAEIHRAATPMLCDRYIRIHCKDGSLPVQEQDATDTPYSTGNEIMAQIATQCENCGLELLDDGIYTSDGVKLGEVGSTNGVWWVIRASSVEQKVVCESVESAVRMLLIVETVSYEELLDKAFDELTADEWGLLMESEAVRELVAA